MARIFPGNRPIRLMVWAASWRISALLFLRREGDALLSVLSLIIDYFLGTP